jgi:transcriptional regulator with XRE-family HTH domain
MQNSVRAASARTGDRPPIFSALEVLGFTYAHIGRLLGVSTMTVSNWATGKKPIPVVRYLALLYLAARLTGLIGKGLPPLKTRYTRRSKIALDAATAWCNLARDELDEDTRGIYRAEDVERGEALGQRIVDRLEAQ